MDSRERRNGAQDQVKYPLFYTGIMQVANSFRDILKRVLGFPKETNVVWKSHDSSIQQRTAIDDARKEKSNQHSSGRNGTKDTEPLTSKTSDKK